MPILPDFTEEEIDALVAAGRSALSREPPALLPKLRALRSALSKIDPVTGSEPQPELQAADLRQGTKRR
jgi:predicted DNA-binding transcriptional regulator YafY